MPNPKKIQQELEKERERIKKILAKQSQKDTDIKGNYTTAYPQYGDEEEDNTLEREDYEAKLAIEHILEKRLQDIDADLKKIKKGQYKISNNK